MCALAAGGEVVAPDSTEGRERIARMEGKIEDVERQIGRNERTFGPLPLQVALIQKGLDDLTSDLRQMEAAQDKRFERFERKVEDDLETLARSFSGQFAACSSEIAKVADTMREHHRAEQERRQEEAKTVRVERTQDVVSRRTLYGILGASAIGALGVILTPLLNALFG